MLLKLECFKYATSMDFKMVYYHIILRKYASNLCTIILPRVNYNYKRLPMGVIKSLEIFQEKMYKIFKGFK